MAISRWRSAGIVDGPQRATVKDIAELNEVFSAAFTDRYRRDGLSGVRVPYLNPIIWRYAIEDAAAYEVLLRQQMHIPALPVREALAVRARLARPILNAE